MTARPYSRCCRTASIRSGRAGGLAGELVGLTTLAPCSCWKRRAAVIGTLILACTYDCNVAPLRERLEANVLLTLLRFFSPGIDHARRGKWARYI
jgi:hypothetical protein